MLTNCIRAGHANWAMAAFIPGVEATKSGMEGAMSGGMLKDAKTVTLSRRQKSEYEILGTVGTAEEDEDCGAPKNLANRESLYTHRPMLTVVVVRNLAVPGNTVEKGLFFRVDETVSIVLAVRYVEV